MAAILGFLLAIQSVAARPPQPDLPTLIKRVQPSVVTVLTYDSEGKPLKQGSGFFIGADGRFVTNFHVLEGAYRADVKTLDGPTYDVKSVLADDPAADLVIAGLADPEKAQIVLPQFRPLTLSRARPEIGQSVVAIGSPLGLEQTVSTGIISAVRTDSQDGEVLQTTAAISPGSSGSPVVNMRGEVVGVATFQYKEGQSLNFAVQAQSLLDLVQRPFSAQAPPQIECRITYAVLPNGSVRFSSVPDNCGKRPLLPVPAKPEAKPDPQLDFEAYLDAWDRKAESIKIAMTYQEMIAVAGTPRRIGTVGGFEKDIFDSVKYNYGRTWVYFTNQVITRIRQEGY